METQHFPMRTAPADEDGLRDLSPTRSHPIGRMEQSGNDHCGCGAPTACTGYEGCGEGSWGISAHPLAMVYAPCQHYRALYDPATALSRGTLFTELDLPLGSIECGFSTEGCACRLDRPDRPERRRT